jgi:fructosamine-3-kinase
MGGSQWAQFARYDMTDGRRVFVKTSASGDCSMFRGERAGLDALRATGAFAVPEVYGSGAVPEGDGCFIAMEFLDFGGRGDQGAFGEALAMMHLATPSHAEARDDGAFGFEVNNTIGETRQPNPWTTNWVEFWRDHRLMHQIKLARDPTLTALAEKVVDKRLDDMFSGCGTITPSLLHGDLWSGNIGTVGGKPAVFDPAVYYGHHEAEFGMSWCAGFNGQFREAYHAKIPKAPGFEERAEMYKLYHILNHYNMFGGGYYGECVSILKGLS